MKTIAIMRLRPGAENQRKAFELFATHGPSEGNEWLLASVDTKIYFAYGDSTDPDLTSLATYAPYFDIEFVPVVAADDAWATAMQEAIGRQA